MSVHEVERDVLVIKLNHQHLLKQRQREREIAQAFAAEQQAVQPQRHALGALLARVSFRLRIAPAGSLSRTRGQLRRRTLAQRA